MTNEVPMKFQMLCETEVDLKKKKITKERKNDTRRQQQNFVVHQDQPAWGEEEASQTLGFFFSCEWGWTRHFRFLCLSPRFVLLTLVQ